MSASSNQLGRLDVRGAVARGSRPLVPGGYDVPDGEPGPDHQAGAEGQGRPLDGLRLGPGTP